MSGSSVYPQVPDCRFRFCAENTGRLPWAWEVVDDDGKVYRWGERSFRLTAELAGRWAHRSMRRHQRFQARWAQRVDERLVKARKR